MSMHIPVGIFLQWELFSTNETRKCDMIKHSEVDRGL